MTMLDDARKRAKQNRPAVKGKPPATEGGSDSLNLTDRANGQRLVRRDGVDLRYVGLRRKWLTWSGNRWQIDWAEVVMEDAKATACELFSSAIKEMQAIGELLKETGS